MLVGSEDGDGEELSLVGIKCWCSLMRRGDKEEAQAGEGEMVAR